MRRSSPPPKPPIASPRSASGSRRRSRRQRRSSGQIASLSPLPPLSLPDLSRQPIVQPDRHPAGGRQSLSSEIGTALNAVAQNCFRGRGAVIRRRGALAMTLGALVAVTGFMDQGIIATRAAVELPVRALKIPQIGRASLRERVCQSL